MSWKEKLKNEFIAMLLATLFFGIWFSVFLFIKSLILAEHDIAFSHYSMALIGALIIAKVVIILEHVRIFPWLLRLPAWVDLISRTAFYTFGVFIVLVLERGFEGRHESGGFTHAVIEVLGGVELGKVMLNLISVSGALLIFNYVALIRQHLGKGALIRMLRTPPPAEASDQARD